ncbi:MAG TPA: hypothetical protein VM534_09625, partial [Thermoanaerobaculia bacterium]|nr:hypothetical protein [Thermoanaerobaculia bacterium]
IGPRLVNDPESIERYGRLAAELTDDFWVMPFGHDPGTADDHLHLDLGYVSVVPRDLGEEPHDRTSLPPVFEERRHGERRLDQPGVDQEDRRGPIEPPDLHL